MIDDQESKSIVQAIEPIQDSEGSDNKEEIRRDVFTTLEEAEDRAKEIGCNGTHTLDEDGNKVYMPCSTHEDYLESLSNYPVSYTHLTLPTNREV